jgi:predicted TPR repeat methyltransferase
MQRNKYDQAMQHFTVIEQTYPQHVESQINLATCYLKLGYINEAKSRYLKVLEGSPGDTQIFFNLGVISTQQGRINEAIDYYLQALKLDANFHDAHNNLGVAYLTVKDANSALLHFREALRIQPNDEAVRHTINILTHEKKLSVSPPEYIRSLFDSYADHYDSHLLQSLHYQVPECLFHMVKDAAGLPGANWEVLDLGCGTGLTADLFKPYAGHLVGVDLSGQMLQVARQKNVYDELIESDLMAFLAEKVNQYDLIVAGDTLVYFGDLEALFSIVTKALKPGGLFAFNTEISNKEDFLMTDSGRFAHHKGYIEGLAQQNQLSPLQYQAATMRTQNDMAVVGHFYLLKKQP